MADVMCHPLGTMPWSLANAEGLLCKTTTAALAAALLKNVAQEQELPQESVTVIDGMSLVQNVTVNQENFGAVASSVLNMGEKSKWIDIVFDTYRDVSIKDYERSVRGQQHGHELKNITSQQKVRQWQEFLKGEETKQALSTSWFVFGKEMNTWRNWMARFPMSPLKINAIKS